MQSSKQSVCQWCVNGDILELQMHFAYIYSGCSFFFFFFKPFYPRTNYFFLCLFYCYIFQDFVQFFLNGKLLTIQFTRFPICRICFDIHLYIADIICDFSVFQNHYLRDFSFSFFLSHFKESSFWVSWSSIFNICFLFYSLLLFILFLLCIFFGLICYSVPNFLRGIPNWFQSFSFLMYAKL